MAKTIKQIIDEVKTEALSFVGAKRELAKLEAIEKGVPAGIKGVYYLIMAVIGLTALLFLQVVIALLFAMIFASDLLSAYDTVSALAAGFGSSFSSRSRSPARSRRRSSPLSWISWRIWRRKRPERLGVRPPQ